MSANSVRGTVAGMAQRANPAFAGGVVLLAIAALGYTHTVASLQHHTYIHVMAGVLWTGIDIFLGAVLGPVVGGLKRLDAWADRRWQAVFAVVTVGSLAWVGLTIGQFQMTTPVMVLTLVIVTVLSVQGFGFLLSGEVRMYLEMTSANPDPGVISSIGEQNAKLGGVQGVFQLVLILVMVYLRYGGL